MQISLALQGLAKVGDDEDWKKSLEERKIQKNVGEIARNPNLMNFMLNFIKDMKNDSLQLLIT
jgi:hypothetical protein